MLSNEIIKILDALAERFGIAVDWTAENIIPYLTQLGTKYVNYEMVTSIVYMILGVIFGVIGIVLWRKLYKNKEFGVERKSYCGDDYGVRFFSYFGLSILCLISYMIITTQIFDIVKCCTFPEMIIIEELKSIYSSMNN